MSILESTTETAKSGTRTKQSSCSSQDVEELAKLDSIYERIRKCVPATPYILTVPTDHPYRHWSQQESQGWMLGNLFDPDEEHLQYRTFKFRESLKSCFVTRIEEDEEKERNERSMKSRGRNTPVQGPKKKISLSAYKANKANGLSGTPTSKKPSPDLGPVKRDPIHVNGVKDELKASTAPKPASQQRQKRPLDNSADHEQPSTKTNQGIPPQKKAKTSQSPAAKRSPETSAQSNATPHGLPPLLSPVGATLPNPYGLPPILSPTLPPNILAELDRLETQRKRAESNASSSSDKKSQLLPPSDLKNQKSDEALKGVARIANKKVEIKTRPGTSENKSLASSQNSILNQRENPRLPPSGKEQTLVVKLKYGRKHRKEVERYLRLPPSSASAAADKKERIENMKERLLKGKPKQTETSAGRSKEASKDSPQTVDVSTPNTATESKMSVMAEKRPRPDDDSQSAAVASKRQKPTPAGVDTDKKPSTPAQQAIPSPALSNLSSAQKSQGQYITPRKDLRAINMIRTNSAEGNDSTPGRSGSTPSGPKLPDSKPGPTSAPVNGRQAESQAWALCSRKLNMLGRSLKHEAQKIAEKEKTLKEDQMRAAVISIECVLSYMAAYYAMDLSFRSRGRLGDVEGNWKTLMPLWSSFRTRTKDFPHLEGLRLHLGAVIAARISTLLAQRGRPHVHHDSPQHDVAADFAVLAENFQQLQRYSHEARGTLSLLDLMEHYPKTWNGREVTVDPMEWESLTAGVLKGPYFLPIGPDTTPVQAVRFGVQLLKEWMEKEGVKYDLLVNLEKGEELRKG